MRLDKKRRISRKTNYNKRLKLLKGNCLRLVVRKTNKYIIVQIVKSLNAQDKVLFSVNTKILTNFGWPKDKLGSLKSISASYLAGYLIGKKSKIDSRIILDSGIIPSTTGSRIYACVKGVSDAGLDIKFDKEIAPSEERIRGTNLKSELGKEFDKIKSEIDKSKF